MTTRRKFRKNLLFEVDREHQRQVSKWGEQDHPKEKWLSILIEEVGEVANAELEGKPLHEYVDELIQTAAVAIAAAADALWKESNGDNT